MGSINNVHELIQKRTKASMGALRRFDSPLLKSKLPFVQVSYTERCK